MSQGDGPRFRGEGGGTGPDEGAVPPAGAAEAGGTDDGVVAAAEEILDAELIDEDTADDTSVVDGESVVLDPLETAIAQRDEYLDSLRRLQAEFENYKKRVAKQQAEQVSRAAASLVDKLLPVLDALDLATDHVGDDGSAEAKALIAANGLLQGVLAKEGLERIDPVGEEFDPTAHEAVGQVPAPEGTEPSASGEPVVAQVMRAGYRWHGTVVRPAMVMVQS